MGEFPNRKTQFSKTNQPLKNGRPKGSQSIKTVFQNLVERLKDGKDPINNKPANFSMLEWTCMKVLAKAVNGDLRAAEILFERLEGKPNQKTDLELSGNVTIDKISEIFGGAVKIEPDKKTD